MTSETDQDLTLRRRDFLLAGAGVALLPSVSWRPGEDSCEQLAIGYLHENRVVPASRLADGDPLLARNGIRVEVSGVAVGRDLRPADLWIRFEVVGADPVDYLAWSYRAMPVENVSSPNRFTVPADAGLALALELEDERFETRLVTSRLPGLPKLRTGEYLIFPTGRLEEEPILALSVEPA